MHCFEDVTAVIFVSALNDYDCPLGEGDSIVSLFVRIYYIVFSGFLESYD